MVKDEPVKTITYPLELYAYDINVSILYAELPLFFGYHHFFEKLQVMLYVGPSIRTTIRDYTEKSNGEIIYDSPEDENYDEYQTYPFEFVQGDYEDPTLFQNTACGVNIICYSNYPGMVLI